jgi:Glycosyltransferase family 87
VTERAEKAGPRGVNCYFTEHWIGACASGVALGYVSVLAWQLIWNSWRLGGDGKDCRDFTWIWLSSKFAQSGTPVQVYDHSAFSAARALLVGAPNCVLGHFDNPPTILFFTYPLGSMPYSIAFAAWMAATLLVYLAAVHTIVPRPVAVVAALAPFPVFINALLGHNGFLTAGLIGLALAFIERRPLLSGIFVGLLTYKPQFGILFPLALLVSRNWRALLSAATASLIFAIAAAIAFGYQTWPAFIDAVGDRAASLSGDQRLNFWLVSVAGFLRLLGVSAPISWTLQSAVTAAVALAVCILWARPIPYPLKAAALAAGAVLAAPHAFGYDACILSIAVAFIVKDGLSRGFLPRERLLILLCWAGLFVLRGPVPAIICVVLLVLAVRRDLGFREPAVAAPGRGWQTQGQGLL